MHILAQTNEDGEHLDRLKNKGLEYLKKGFKLVPVGYGTKEYGNGTIEEHYKKGLMSWASKWISTPQELESAFSRLSSKIFGIAVITGEISGITVVDVDDSSLLKYLDLPDTLHHTTGRGHHYIYRYEPSAKNGPHPEWHKVDIMNGSLIVLPPSKHHSGVEYSLVENYDVDLDNLPEFPRRLLVTDDTTDYIPSRDIHTTEVLEGSRNSTGIKVARYLVAQHGPDESYTHLEQWNKSMCMPPLATKELKSIHKSAIKYHERDGSNSIEKRESLADKLIRHISSLSSMELFNSNNEGYIQFEVNGILQISKLRSSTISSWVTKLCYENFKTAPSRETVHSVIGLLSAQALFDSKQRTIYTRVGKSQDMIYYDLCNEKWEAVEITASGWHIEPSAHKVFERFRTTRPSYVSTASTPLTSLLELYNLPKESDRLLLQVLLIYYLIPNVKYPILTIFGDHGSGKSTMCRIIRTLVDPNINEISEFPRKEDDFVVQISQCHLSIFDNISAISNEQSDRLCRAATGGTLSKRKLYTDDESIVVNYTKPIILNGINLGSYRPDLMDRSILIHLERIPPDRRMTEEELDAVISASTPEYLAYCFNVLSKAMELKKEARTEPELLGRMADFEKWGWYITEALGYTHSEFIAAIQTNKVDQVFEAISNNSLAQSIVALAESEHPKYWSGTPSQLFTKLKEGYPDAMSSIKSAQYMMRRLNELKPDLASVGIIIETGKETNSTRFVRITKADTDTKDGPDDVAPINPAESALF